MASTNSFFDCLKRKPDILEDEKVNAAVADIFDSMLKFSEQANKSTLASLVTSLGNQYFIKWYVTDVYMPSMVDLQMMLYVNEHLNDVADILDEALINVSPEQILDEVEGVEGGRSDAEKEVIEDETGSELGTESEEEQEDQERREDLELQAGLTPLDIANAIIDDLMGKGQ